jgi:hypothetical protein
MHKIQRNEFQQFEFLVEKHFLEAINEFKTTFLDKNNYFSIENEI